VVNLNHINIIVLEQKWMVIEMVSHVKANGAAGNFIFKITEITGK
jgi:hypothetical protein